MSKTRQLVKLEFNVRGKEGYYVCLEFKKVREEMVKVIQEMYQIALGKLEPILSVPADESSVKDVKWSLSMTKGKTQKKVWKNVPLKNVVAAEYALVTLQVEMLDKAVKL